MLPKFKYVEQSNVLNRFLPITKSVELGLEPEPKISDFNIIKELGSGSFSKVLLVQHNKTKAKYALKTIDKKSQIDEEEKKQLLREVEIMYKIHHPNVVKLFGHFEDNSFCYLLMEYVEGGELFSLIPEDGKSKITNQQIASLIKDVISAVYYMHHMKPTIMHRDIKPENILITSNMQAKLTDFGWSNYIQPGNLRNSICGTPIYLAPEMISRIGHDEKVDIWSIGVLLFELLTGDQAWAGDNVETVKYNICSIKISWPDDMNTLAADLISKILKFNPDERLSLKDILNHPFFTQYFANPTSCLLTPDNRKYKVFIISKDNPITYNPYCSDENHQKQQKKIKPIAPSAYTSQTYNQNNYNYLFDKYNQNELNQVKKQEFIPATVTCLKRDSDLIEKKKISWPLEEKNGFEKDFSKNGNQAVMWGTTSYDSYQNIYSSFDEPVFLGNNNQKNGKYPFALSSKNVIPSNNIQDYLSDNLNNGKKSFTQSSKIVIPGNNNIQVGTSYDFTTYNTFHPVNTFQEKKIYKLKEKEKKMKEIEEQLYNAFNSNNHEFGSTLTFEQRRPEEFQDYLF